MQDQDGPAQARKQEGGGSWFVYVARCADRSLYTGVATDVRRRLAEHNEDNGRGARYTRGRRPITLIHVEEVASRAAALRREIEIKRLRRKAKEKLAATRPAEEEKGALVRE
jgi:putative endonuclease